MECQPENDFFTELSIGKEEMLYALNSTLEALEDGSILKEEYYVRFDTPHFQHELLKWKVRSTFEAVEYGHLTEDDFYFVLITPYFYYRSGSYNKLENLQSTLQALVDTYNDESGNELLQEHIVSTFEEWIASCKNEVVIVLHAAELGNGIPEVEVSFKILLWIITYLLKILHLSVSKKDDSVGSTDTSFDFGHGGSAKDEDSDKGYFQILLGIFTCMPTDPYLPDSNKDSVGTTHTSFDLVDGGTAEDEQSDTKGYFQILLGIFTYMPTDPYLPDSNKNLDICTVCSYCLRGFEARKLIRRGLQKQLNNCGVFLFLFLFAVSVESAEASHPEKPLTLRAGSNGVIPFNCSVSDPADVSNVYYTVRFEAKDRPFCVDGVIHPEGFFSPDQSERFSIKFSVDINTLAVNINIALVSTEDEGTYELQTLYKFGSNDVESHFMTQIVKVHVPPSPAMCYFKHYANYPDKRLLRCHCTPGSGNSTLSCFQNGAKIPFWGQKGAVTSRTFWIIEDASPVVCCSHEYGEPEDVTADSCGQQFRFPHHIAKTTVPPMTESKGGSVVDGFHKPTNVILPKATGETGMKGSGYVMHSSIIFSTLLPMLTFLMN